MKFPKPTARMRHALRWAISVPLAMAFSFIFVNQFLTQTQIPSSSPKDIAVAADLRQFSNELVLLFNEYVGKHPASSTGDVNGFERWVRRSFQPKLNDFRHRLLGSDLSTPEHSALLAAADRASAMAAKPRDERALRSAQEAVLSSASQTDQRVAKLKSGSGMIARPAAASFSRP